MDGKDYLRRLREILDEESTGSWLDPRTSYDNIWEGAKEFTSRTACLTDYYEFVTVANQANYTLPANFLKLYLKDSSGSFYVKYSIGASDSFIKFKDINEIRRSTNTRDIQQGVLTTDATTLQDTGQDFSDWETSSGNAAYRVILTNTVGDEFWAYLGAASTTTNTDDTVAVYSDLAMGSTGWNNGTPTGTESHYRIEAVSTRTVPSSFCIKDKESLYSQITGTATSDGDKAAGECTLTNSGGLFLTTDYVNKGDTVHNTTDESDGVVTSITSATALKCALFGGAENEWDTSDAYVIQPQGRLDIILDPAPSTSGYIVRVDFIKVPDPVYTDYGIYRFRQHAMEAIIKYAAWLYKYRDEDMNEGDALFQWWDRAVRREISDLQPHLNQRKYKVSFRR